MFLAQAVKTPTNNNEKNWQTPFLITPLTQNVNHKDTDIKKLIKIYTNKNHSSNKKL